MNFGPTAREVNFFAGAPKRNLFHKRRRERLLALDDVEEGETQAEVECDTDEDCDQGCECSEEGECECEDSLTASDYSEEQPRDETGKWTSGEGGGGGGTHLSEHPGVTAHALETGGSGSGSSGTEGHPAHTRVYQRVAAATGEPKEMVEVVPLTKQLFDQHVAKMTSDNPLAVGRQSGAPSTFEKAVGKGFEDAAFVVTPRGTRVFWMLGKKGFTPPGAKKL